MNLQEALEIVETNDLSSILYTGGMPEKEANKVKKALNIKIVTGKPML